MEVAIKTSKRKRKRNKSKLKHVEIITRLKRTNSQLEDDLILNGIEVEAKINDLKTELNSYRRFNFVYKWLVVLPVCLILIPLLIAVSIEAYMLIQQDALSIYGILETLFED